jgi:hypothetical protein
MRVPLGTVLGVAGALAAVVWAGLEARGRPTNVSVMAGSAVVGAGRLHLEPGSVVLFGRGATLQVRTTAATELDLIRGELGGEHLFGHVGPVAGLFRHDFSSMGTDPPANGPRGGVMTAELRCASRLELLVDGRILASDQPDSGCAARPLSLRVAGAADVVGVSVDGQPMVVRGLGFDWATALAVGGGLAVGSAVLGLAGWAPLLLTPLATFADALGVPARAIALVVLAAAFFNHAVFGVGRRRWVGAAGTLVAFGVAAILTVPPRKAGTHAWEQDRGGAGWVDAGLLERKVTAAADRIAVDQAALPAGRPLFVAFGSSASGGDTAGTFWPQLASAKLDDHALLAVTVGGATTWHLSQVRERLRVEGDICVSYSGNNDRMPSFPGVTIAGVLRGDKPQEGWMPPVTLEEGRANIMALAGACRRFYAMAEHVQGRDAEMAEYDRMLRTIPGITVLDARTMLAALPQSAAMLDDVHPSPTGQRALADFVVRAVTAP